MGDLRRPGADAARRYVMLRSVMLCYVVVILMLCYFMLCYADGMLCYVLF